MLKSTVRECLLWTAATFVVVTAGSAWAQNYPNKPIRLFVGFSAGAAPDVIARLMAPALNQQLGQSWIVENRGGAGGSLATEAVSKAAPDGYTLLMMAAADTLQPALRAKLPYNLERDFAPVTLLVTGMSVMTVHPSLPVKNVKELIALARANPGKLNYGSSGIGSSSHLMGELFNMMANVKMPMSRIKARRKAPPPPPPARSRSASPASPRSHRCWMRASCGRLPSPVPSARSPFRTFQRSTKPVCPATTAARGSA